MEAFRQFARQLSGEYLSYIRLKLAGEDATLSAALTGYPAEKEQLFCRTRTDQYRLWMEHLQPESEWTSAVQTAHEIAIWLDRPVLWDAFLKAPFSDFFIQYCAFHQLSVHSFASLAPDTVYFGNQYCPQLIPEPAVLSRLLNKASAENLRGVIALPPIAEREFSKLAALLQSLSRAVPGNPELVVNDWGTLFYLCKQYPRVFRLTAGSMLFRSTRDPRFYWQPALNIADLSGISEALTCRLQKEYGVQALSLELAFSPVPQSSMKRCLQLPFYQTNTSSYCTLEAVCTHGLRGKQEPAVSCPQFCRDYAFLYPSFLNMIGVGNSLFGFHGESLEHADSFRPFLRPGLDRIVFLFP